MISLNIATLEGGWYEVLDRACLLHRVSGSCETAEATSVPFYIVALALVGLTLVVRNDPGTLQAGWPYFMPLMQRCARLRSVLFTIVMFVGVLGRELAVARHGSCPYPPPALHPWLHLRAGSPGVLRGCRTYRGWARRA